MQQVNISDLPEPVARVIEAMVPTLHDELTQTTLPRSNQPPVKLSVVDGAVIGNLTREEIYNDLI